jgi:hypothetical protein
MGARWFSPGWGDFISRDTHNGALKSPVTLNRYTYANDDPLGYTDPDGHYGMMIDGRAVRYSPDPALRPPPPPPAKHKTRGMEPTPTQKANTALRGLVLDELARFRRQDAYNDPRKDPFLMKLAHAIVLTNMDTFDSADERTHSRHVNPDGNIAKVDFQDMASGRDPRSSVLTFAASMMLANDKDLSDDERQNLRNGKGSSRAEDYGWRLYAVKHDRSIFDSVMSVVSKIAMPLIAIAAFTLCEGIAGAATEGAGAVAAAPTCAAISGGLSRLGGSLSRGDAVMSTLRNVTDPKSVTTDLVLGALTDGESTSVRTATEAATPRETLFHYTDEAGQNGILDSGQLNPSLKSVNPADARYGNGQYLSDVQPGSMSCAQLSRCFLGQPFQGSRFTNYVEIDVTGLDIIKGRPGVFVNPSETPLDLAGRIVSWGRN